MNRLHRLKSHAPTVVLSIAVVGLNLSSDAQADVVKANNSTALNDPNSYTPAGVPTAGDRIILDSTVAANQTPSLGGDLSILGIYLDPSFGRVLTIGGSDSLTLGAAGIDIDSGSGSNLFFNGPELVIGTDQTWDLGGRGTALNGSTSINENGNDLVITSSLNAQLFIHNGTSTLGAQLTGNLGLTLDSAPGTADLTLTNTTSTTNGSIAISAGSSLSAADLRGAASDPDSAIGVGQVFLKGGTFRYTGNTATTNQNISYDSRVVSTFEATSPGQALTVNTLNIVSLTNSGGSPNGLVLGGAGDLIINDNINNPSAGSSPTPSSLTKFGTGSVTLRQTNSYQGPTAINAGSLILVNNATINNSSSISLVAGATLTNNTAAAVTPTLSLDEGASINGSGTFSPTSLSIDADLADGFDTFDLGAASLSKDGEIALTLANVIDGSYTLFAGTTTGAYTSFIINGEALAADGGGNFSGTVGDYDYLFDNATNVLSAAIPEPASFVLLAAGLFTVGLPRHHQRRQA